LLISPPNSRIMYLWKGLMFRPEKKKGHISVPF
jgi:hypothetical protein